jgi:farnesyl diphosphate synthase
MLRAAPEGFLLNPSLKRIAGDIDQMFEAALIPAAHGATRLHEAMRYAVIGGGKRLRPLLVAASAGLFGVPRSRALRAGLAVECIHAHSLIHDDLPCMDDDDLRRGKPTVHRAFDEATAVLAGDALHALAFEVLSDPRTHPDAAVRAELVCELAKAVGAAGMAGGQMLDLLADGRGFDLAEITRMQRLKTGALIGWCLEAGAIMGYAAPALRRSLRGYSQCIGLAFQIADDLLDAEGDERTVGKRIGKDAAQGKETFVSLLGAPRARAQAELLVSQAVDHLKSFGEDGEILRAVARFTIERKN